MSCPAPDTGSRWLRWFPAHDPARPTRWRLLRFDKVDSRGNPVGKAVVAMTPANFPRTFRSESIAAGAANVLNEQDGL